MADINASRAPTFVLTVGGIDITPLANARLKSLTLTDNRGFEADTLEITLDDSDGSLELPRKGAEVRVAIGWADTGVVDKGSYTVDDIEHSGAPDQLVIRARSADLREGLTTKRDHSWHGTTLGIIVTEIAGRHGLTPAVAEAMASVPVEHLDQTNESDANLLTRVSTANGAIASVKDGRLVVIAAGAGRTASGKPIPAVVIERTDGDRHQLSMSDREAYTAVRAWFFDVKAKLRGEVLVNAEQAKTVREQATTTAKPKPGSTGAEATPAPDLSENTTGNVLTLRHTYSTKANALRAAAAAWSRIQRGVATMTFTLAYGRPDLIPEQPARVLGIKAQIDAVDWTISRITHTMGETGYSTTVELETRTDEIPDVSEG